MQWLAKLCVKRPVFASVITLIIVVLGGFSYLKLGVDNFPDVDIPYVIVTTRLPGAAPEEVESEVTDRIEGSVNTIGGIDELRSVSTEGVSQVIVAFRVEKDADVATQEVRDKIDLVLADLPEGVDPPVVTRVDPSASAVLLLALRSDLDTREVTEIADKKVRRQIESIDGVGQVEIVGGRARQYNVLLDPAAMRAHDVTAAEVFAGLGRQNVSVPGGSLEAGPAERTVRVRGRVETAENGAIVLRSTSGRPVRVSDVARVEDGMAEEETSARLDGEPVVLLSVKKQAGRNTVAVVDSILKRLGDVEKTLPAGVRVEVIRDNSGVIRTGIAAVTEHLVLGALLAALVVLLFLGNVRSTVIAAVAIPISIIGTFAIMQVAGFTLNFLTLLALALAVGIVIDDAIVVLENIVRYIDEKGMKPFVAAVLATKEIGLAVLATSLSLMAVFVPIAFMGGIPGRFLASFGLTMAFSIAVSLFVSFTLTPMLGARLLRPGGHDGSRLARIVDHFYKPIERGYVALLSFCMRRRWIVVLASVATLASCGPLVQRVPSSFLPPDDQARFEVSVKAPEGTSLPETRLVAERIANDARRYEGVTRTLVTVGEGDAAPANEAKVYVFLTDPAKRAFSQQHLMQRVRDEVLPRHATDGVQAIAGEVPEFSSGQSQAKVQFALVGPDIDRLDGATRKIVEGLRQFPQAVDVDTTLAEKKPELGVSIDRERAALLGVQVSPIADALRLFVGGVKATTVTQEGEPYDVRIRADERFRAEPDTLALLGVSSPKAGVVGLDQLVTFSDDTGPSRIDRYGRQRQYTILANAAPGVGTSVVEAEVRRLAAEQGLPPEYRLIPVGPSKTGAELVSGFLMVIVLGFVFMYLVLAAQFESWSQPAIILLSLPLTVPFALVSLLLLGQSLNLFSALGLLVLFGVVKKNAILQIDHTNHLRALGRPKLEAIIEANRDRLRPILMTTLAFVAGMVPLVFSRGVGAGKNQASSGIVLGGQLLSLLLTLVAVPVAYDLFDQAASWFSRLRRKQDFDRGEADLERYEAGGSPEPAAIAAEE